MVGYFYWGFLGDKKFDATGNLVSTPDGNAFYSWSIIKALQNKGKCVYLFSDRDSVGYRQLGKDLFSSFASEARNTAYINTITGDGVYPKDLEYVIVEWRWPIPGRNDAQTKVNNPAGYQPDREMMENIIAYYNSINVPVIVFDLDYKLTLEEVKQFDIKYIIELGNKWNSVDIVKSETVQIPFDFTYINEFDLKTTGFSSELIYIGNRYERDWCIDKYLPNNTVIHGNWLEPGHGDPVNEWPNLIFRKRLSASEIQKPYNEALCTILLAKKEYCEMGFMTARVQEAVFYGTVPLFIEEYGKEVINKYAGKYAELLTVTSKDDVKNKINMFKNDITLRNSVIMYMRKHLRFMDSKFFVNDIEELIYGK